MDNARVAWERPGVLAPALKAMLVVLAASASLGENDPQAEAEAMYRKAEMDDGAGEYARALEEYRATAERLPSSRYAPRALARASILASHSEGDFAPYRRLEHVRRDPALSEDPATLDALAREADTFPPGLVRVEARMVCAEAYLNRLARPADGMRALRLVLADPLSDDLTQRQAARALVDGMIAEGDLDGALATARDLAPKLDAAELEHVHALVWRRALRRGSMGDLALLLAGSSASIVLAMRRGTGAAIARALRRTAPIALGFAIYVALVGAALASGYEAGNGRPFLCLGVALFPLLLVARAWGAAGSPRPWARATRGAVCGVSVAAAGFLLLEWIDPAYLEGFGL